MENQHRKISGYRELSEAEIALMNEAKDLEAQVVELQAKIQAESVTDTAARSASIAKTHLQTGFMWLTRAVARPNGE